MLAPVWLPVTYLPDLGRVYVGWLLVATVVGAPRLRAQISDFVAGLPARLARWFSRRLPAWLRGEGAEEHDQPSRGSP